MNMKIIFLSFFIGCMIFACQSADKLKIAADMPVKDIPFKAPVSVKYGINPKWADAVLKKVVVDGDNNVFVLTDNGLYRDFPGEILSKDLRYGSLADKIPTDVCIQEATGYLYYLYHDRFLTNAHAGAIYGHLPDGRYTQIAVNANDDVLLTGAADAALFHKNDKKAELALPSGKLIRLYVHDKSFWYLTDNAIYRLDGNSWKEVHKGASFTSLAFSGDRIAIGTPDGYYVIDTTGKTIEEKNNRLPATSITGILYSKSAESDEDCLWFASDEGVYRKDPERFRYFASKRWLDQNQIIDMTADKSGNIYALTSTGLNKIDFPETTMLAKAEFLQDNLRKYHYRYGFSNDATLLDPNDPTSLQLRDTDNDGLWTVFWFGSQVFRYAATGSEEAKRFVWESFEAYERLISIHHITGFSGRSFERKGYNVSDLERWRPAVDSADWVWKGTTSTDEYVAYIFAAALLDQYVSETPEDKKRVADYIDAIMTHIITNNYYFIDVDGEPTLWGRWNAEYVNSFAKTQFDRRLNSCLTVAGLQLAYKLTGKELYKTEAFRVMDEWGYFENMKIPMKNIAYTTGFQHKGITMGEDWNHSDDEMAFPTYWVLYQYALNDTLKQTFADITRDHWEIERPERHGLWNLIAYSITGDIDLDATVSYLKEFPTDRRRYAVRNSHRKDLEFLPRDVHTNFRMQTTTQLPPKDERPMNRDNSNEFNLDSREGNSILAGDEYLLPYWMARFL
ncbi:MAG: hypothetical protein LBE56_06690 [Tannerella sp.]|jgi:hypothetical protein|nr:hypothetical protein [Tannerella sp.]